MATPAPAVAARASANPSKPDGHTALMAEFAAIKAPVPTGVGSSSDSAAADAPPQLDAARPVAESMPSDARPETAGAGVAEASPAIASPAPVTTPPVKTSPPPAPPRDAIATATELQASPMSTAQQIEVLGLVKNLAAQLRDTRLEVAQMRQVVSQVALQVETKTTDFDTRLSMAEAAAMVLSSAKAGAPPVPAHDTAPTPATPATAPAGASLRLAAARSVVPTTATLAPVAGTPPDRRTVKDYVLKGASPGLAVLASLNPVPGSATVIEVGVGDPVPGLGRIKRVYQRGTSWIVDTEGGSIQ